MACSVAVVYPACRAAITTRTIAVVTRIQSLVRRRYGASDAGPNIWLRSRDHRSRVVLTTPRSLTTPHAPTPACLGVPGAG